MPGPEGLVFGAGGHLPDASALHNFSARDNPQLGQTVWGLREHPEAVVRLQRDVLDDNTAYWQLARQGIAHLQELEDLGIPVPPQRFVLGPRPSTSSFISPRLYAIADRLEGRNLTTESEDAPYAQTVINGTASYVLRRVAGDRRGPHYDRFLFDTGYPWQHTLLDKPNTAGQHFLLRDTGLEFADMANALTKATMRGIGLYLLRWSRQAATEQPEDLNKLLAIVESPAQRRYRLQREREDPAFRFPAPPPPDWAGHYS